MTTATRRLRRTGAATLVAAVTAGVTLLATAGSALAAFGTVTNRTDLTTGATTIYPGTSAAAIGSLDLNLTNAFNIGDTFTVSLGQHPGCGTTGGAIGFSSAPTVTASGPTIGTYGTGGSSADASSTSLPTFTVATQSSAGACTTAGIKDQLLITFTNSAAGLAADNFELVVGGQAVNVGSAVTTGAVAETTVTTSGATVVTVATPPTVATVANTKASITETQAAPGTSTGVALNPLTLSEVTAGAFLPAGTATAVTLTLAGVGAPVFTGAVTPTITVPAGYTVTPAATTAVATYTFTVTAPATAVAATVVVSGLTVNLTTAVAGIVTINASTGAVANIGGGVQPAISVLTQTRTGGTDRYATAGLLFTGNSFTGGTNHVAVIASGANYPDALSANYLAAGLNPALAGTRVLLTDPNVLPQPTTQALITGAITTVYIVGGTAAVSTNVSNAIAAMHVGNNNANAFINVIRVAGADRYATNNQVDLYNGASAVNTAVVAVGSNFADALAVAPVVVTHHFPLVLTDGSTLSTSAQSTLVNLGIKNVLIVGGTSAISAAVEASIKALGITIVYRIAGADRTLTASSIATYETTATATAAFPATATYAQLNGLGMNLAQVYVARGDGFADALAAGTVAGGVGGSPVGAILLTGDPSTLGAGIPAYLSGKHGVVTALTTLGLTSAISVATANAAVASIS